MKNSGFELYEDEGVKFKSTKLRGLSPRANYTDRATAACRRSKCQLFAGRGCSVVGATDPDGLIFDFLDRSRCFFFQVAPQLYSRGWVDPVPDPLVLGKSGRAGNQTRTSGSVARNPDHYTTEEVLSSYLRIQFLDRSRYVFFQVAPQLYSRGWVDPVPDPLVLGKSGSAGNQTRTSGSVARNSEH
jgi:hypothetical protein